MVGWLDFTRPRDEDGGWMAELFNCWIAKLLPGGNQQPATINMSNARTVATEYAKLIRPLFFGQHWPYGRNTAHGLQPMGIMGILGRFCLKVGRGRGFKRLQTGGQGGEDYEFPRQIVKI